MTLGLQHTCGALPAFLRAAARKVLLGVLLDRGANLRAQVADLETDFWSGRVADIPSGTLWTTARLDV